MEFWRAKYDVNGNPRHVVHYTEIPLTKEQEEQVESDLTLGRFALEYQFALKNARALGGKKFNNKQYGGGIVFQYGHYDLERLEKAINELVQKDK